jgi:hypothetical protein
MRTFIDTLVDSIPVLFGLAVLFAVAFILLGEPVFAQTATEVAPVVPVAPDMATGFIDSAIGWIASALGLSAGTLAVALLVIQRVSEIVVKTIPDTETVAWKVWVRRIARFFAVYKQNVK